MTLKEVKNEIERRSDEAWRKWKKEGCMLSQGLSLGLAEAAELLEEVVPVGKADKWTLRTFAIELRKIFKFRYLTVEIPIHNPYFCLWTEKPYWNGEDWVAKEDGKKHLVTDFLAFELVEEVDFSEYADENGEIDYSKCIVEVSE